MLKRLQIMLEIWRLIVSAPDYPNKAVVPGWNPASLTVGNAQHFHCVCTERSTPQSKNTKIKL